MKRAIMVMACVAACGGEEVPGRAWAPIVNGGPETELESVVALGSVSTGAPAGFCSGTLVTPRIVLSAAHCGEGFSQEDVQTYLRVFFGPDIARAAVVEADAWNLHPSYSGTPAPGEARLFDFSAVVLAEAAPTSPARSALAAPDELTDALSVGYGCTTTTGGEFGVRMSAAVVIASSNEEVFYSVTSQNPNEAHICSGDSGGGMFLDPEHRGDTPHPGGAARLVGVHSEALVILQGTPVATASGRVDRAVPWLLDQVEAVHGTRDLCDLNGWYGDGFCDPGCEAFDEDCVEEGAGGAAGGGAGPGGAGGSVEMPQAPDPEESSGCSTRTVRAPVPPLALGLLALIATRRRATAGGARTTPRHR